MTVILKQHLNVPSNLQQLRLRTLLIAPFVSLVLGSVGIVGYVSYHSGQTAVEEMAQQLMDETGDRVTLYIQHVTEAPHLVNRINADAMRLGLIPGFDTTDSVALEDYFLAQIQQFPSVSTIAIANERGGMIGSGRSDDPQTFYLYRTPDFAGGSFSASIVDALGTVIQADAAKTAPYDATTRPWYEIPVQSGGATWSPIYRYAIDSGLEETVLGISAGLPLYDESGTLDGVLATDITLDQFNQFLVDLEVSPSSQVFIIERSGLLVSSSIQHPLFTSNGEDSERINALDCNDPVIQAAMMQLIGGTGDLMTVDEQSFQFNQDGTQHHMRVDAYNDAFGLDWLIVTVVPESDFMAQIQANLRQMAVLCGLTLVGAIALCIWLARKISAPILALNEATQKFACGQDIPPLLHTRILEVDSLRRTFAQMMSSIKQAEELQQRYTETLEQQVSEKNQVLKEAQHIARVGSWEWTPATDEVIWSKELYRIYEAEDQDPCATPHLDILQIHPDDYDRYHEQVTNLAIAHQPFDAEFRIITQNGNIRHVQAKGQPICNDQGEVLKFIGTVADITDRKHIERALHESEQRYRAIINDQTEMVCRFLPDGTLTFINPSYCRYFDLPESQLLGRTFMELVSDAEQDTVRQVLNDFSVLTPDHPVVTHEHQVVTADGEIRWQQWINRAIFDADGNIKEIQGVGRDITDHKYLEQELTRNRDFRELLFNESTDALFLVDITTLRTLDCNQQAVDLFEVASKDELIDIEGHILQKCQFTPDELTAIQNEINDTGTWSMEVEYISRRGREFWGDLSVKQIAFGGHQFNLVRVTDITERKRTEIALKQSEMRFMDISETSPAHIYILVCRVDGSFYFEHCSQAIEAIHEIPADDILNDAYLLLNCIHPDDREGYTAAVNISMATLEPFQYEWRVITPSGTVKWLQGNSRPRQRENGEIAWYGIVMDITDRKEAEELLRQSEARYFAILEDQTELIKRFRPDGTILFVNDAFCRFYGLPREDVLAHGYKPPIHPEDQSKVEKGLAGLTPQNPVFSLEHRVIVKGEVRWMQWVNRAIYDSQGTLVELQAVGQDIHDRKQAELALEYNNHQLQAFLDNAPAAISQFDANGRYYRVNAKFAGFLKMPDVQMVGTSFDDLFPAETVKLFRTRIQKLLETQQALEIEDEIEVEGELRTFRSILFPVLPDGGLESERQEDPQRFWAIASDITERKRIENALKQKTEELDRFFSVALDLLCIADLDGYFYRLNRQWEATLGCCLDDLEGSRFFDYVHPDDMKKTLDALEALSQNRVITDFVNRYRCHDGTYRWIEWRAVPVGKWVYAAARDITDRKNAEFYLQESEDKFATVFHSNPTPCWIATLDEGRILEINEGFAHFYGTSVTDLIDKTCAELNLWDDPRDYQKFQQILYATRRLPNFEVVLRKQSGEPRTVLISASVNWINGQDCVVGVFNDISDRKHYEAQVQKNLAQKDILLREVHHRVKNNLHLIQSMLQMQENRIDNPYAAQILRESCNRIVAIGLAHEVLYRSGTMTDIDLATYLPALVQQIAAASCVVGWPVPINTHIESILIPTKTAVCCGLIINELVSNALKYAFPDIQDGHIDVSVSVSRNTGQATIQMSVTDDGIGLPINWIDLDGESLGLTLVKDFVTQLQGTLEVESNRGTRFLITFPVPGDRP